MPRIASTFPLLVVIAACGAPSERAPETAAAARAPAPSPTTMTSAACDPAPTRRGAPARYAVQLGAFADSARAARLRDSLGAEGWGAYVGRATSGGKPVFRVRFAPSPDDAWPRLVVAALRAHGREAAVVRDDATPQATGGVAVIPVNRGTHGMAARTRWAASRDGCALLVVEDPTAVEAEPVPDGFVYASERGALVLQRDSVWDVAPSPDWRRLAWGRGFVVSARERDSLSAAQWRTMAERIGLDERAVRQRAFVASGMAMLFGISRPLVAELARPEEDTPRVRALPMTGGWRVRWTPDGALLAVGSGPARAQDDAPPREWALVDPATAAVRRRQRSDSGLAVTRWTEGPTLDISVPVDLAAAAPLARGAVTIESRGGWIRAVERTPDGARRTRAIGPGIALAATAGGRFVAALVPPVDPRETDQPVRFMVYQLLP